ncbi:MAG: AAA family ATPase [Candidatus Latescibacteria bacterium]|nr:AAA family ATPase [Candidatus Latescibacterota bacterium]
MIEELSGDQVRKACDPQALGFATTDELSPVEGIIGQQRAVEALRFGLDMPDRGFNIYVAGLPGTGRTTAVQAFLEERARQQASPADWCYVNNFQDPYRPRALRLPPSRGRELQRDLKSFIERARRDLRQAFDSEEYTDREETLKGELEREQQDLFQRMKQHAQSAGFLLQLTPMGMAFVPLRDGQPIDAQAFAALPLQTRQELETRRQTLQEELKGTLKEVHTLERTAQQRLQQLAREVALYVVGLLVEDLLDQYRELPAVEEHLRAVQEDLLENIDTFRAPPGNQPNNGRLPWAAQDSPFRKYEVNAVVDHGGLQGAPVVIEPNPTYHDLFGRIEKEAQFGAMHTDFTLIRGGSLHRANGGYLVVHIEDVLRNLYAWEGLKRALRNGAVVIEELGERLGFVSTRGLQPEPIPLEVKVVLIGSPLLYHLLYQHDEDFNELFKVKADFDLRMERTQVNIRSYLASICRLCQKEGLRSLDSQAAAKVIEHSSRLAEDQEKLSTHFAQIADLIREANFWAGKEGEPLVRAPHLRRAIEARIYRSSLVQERLQEAIARGTLLIDTEGQAVGRINGLAVLGLGDYAFGRPNRITASIGLGRGGIVDIEREARLGGPLHTKGVLILSGYLVNQYAQDKALALSARLVFEQSYEGVEGDSASSAELYALLSALSGLPIRQGLAVTGSVNQQGQVQAIGGVNEKVEGFFALCQARGLRGDQGVVIPRGNVQHLMLREEVAEAVREGRFHLWPVRSIDEGIEVLTGAPAGQRDSEGAFPPDTVHGRVDQRLRQMGQLMRQGDEGAPSRPGED